MENRALISVIVPNYNHSQFLKERIESILNQTYQNLEIILLDDCSNDDSHKILKEYSSHEKVSHMLINPVNSGSPFKQWVKGIKLAKGEFVWIAESDDSASSFFIERLITKFHQGVDMVFSPASLINRKGEVIKKPRFFEQYTEVEGKIFIHDHLIGKNDIVTGSSVIFRKEVVLDQLEMLSNFRYSGDLYLWISILSRSNVNILSSSEIFYRIHDHNQTAKNDFSTQMTKINEAYKIIEFLLKRDYKYNQVKAVAIFKIRKLFRSKHNYLKIPRYFVENRSLYKWKLGFSSLMKRD